MSPRKPQSSSRRSLPVPGEAVPYDETPSTTRMDRTSFGLRSRGVSPQPSLPLSLSAVESDLLEAERAADSWLHVRWSVSPRTVERARAAVGRGSLPPRWLLRVYRVERDDSGPRCRSHFADVEVSEADREWFLRVQPGDDGWVVELGLAREEDRYFSMMHTVPIVLTSVPRIREEPDLSQRGAGGIPPGGVLGLAVSPILILRGATLPEAMLTIDDQAVNVDPRAGEFEWSTPLGPGRTVFPVEAAADGQIRRALVAVETNIRLLEPQLRDER